MLFLRILCKVVVFRYDFFFRVVIGVLGFIRVDVVFFLWFGGRRFCLRFGFFEFFFCGDIFLYLEVRWGVFI